MENNFIQMAAVAYTIGPIFKRINDCVQLYFINGFNEYCPLKRQWSLACRIIVQRCQIAAPS